jgi:hypothetical protein
VCNKKTFMFIQEFQLWSVTIIKDTFYTTLWFIEYENWLILEPHAIDLAEVLGFG